MVCVPVRGVPLVGCGVLRRGGLLRSVCPRSCRLVWPSGLSDLPGRLVRASSSPAVPTVAAHSAVRGSFARRCRVPVSGFIPGPCSGLSVPVPHGSSSVRVRSSWICKTPACPSRCRVNSPVSSVWLRECSARVLIGPPGSVRCLVRPRRAVPVRRLWCFPLAVNWFRQPVPARQVRCDAVASGFTVNCLPMSSERWMGNRAEDASRSTLPGPVMLPAQVFLPSGWPDQSSSGRMESYSLSCVPFRSARFRTGAFDAVPSLSPWLLVRLVGLSRFGFPVRFTGSVIHQLGVLGGVSGRIAVARN